MPYYFYMCDMIPFSEHWRVSVADAQRLQHAIMGYLPGFATPRIVCDVPFVGKRWVHQLASYDTERGISYWTKNYRTSIEAADPEALSRTYEYYDPIHTLPAEGQAWWAEHASPRRVRAAGRRGGRGVASYGGAAGVLKAPASFAGCARSASAGSTASAAGDGPVLVVRREHDRGAGRHVGGGADPGQQVLEVARAGQPDLEDVGLVARHRPARLDLGDVARAASGESSGWDGSIGRIEMNAVSGSPISSWLTVAPYPRIRPRCSSRLTRWCTAEVESPVAFPRSVKDIRPSAASS